MRAVGGLYGSLVRVTRYLQFYLTRNLCISRSDTLRVYPIRDGGVQNHILLFGENQAQRTAVTRCHFIA